MEEKVPVKVGRTRLIKEKMFIPSNESTWIFFILLLRIAIRSSVNMINTNVKMHISKSDIYQRKSC